MEICEYQEVKTSDNPAAGDTNIKWRIILRQLFVCSGVWSNNFLYGLSLGAPAVVIPQVRQEANSTEAVSEEMASWLSSGFGISGLIWVVILSLLAAGIGRKKSFIVIALNSLVGFMVLYFSNTVLHILIGMLIQGAARSCVNVLSPIIVTEYSSPSHRGLFSTMDSASFFWGIWVANAIGTFAHWNYIAVLGILCSVYAMTALLWPESPHWLATKGRFEECVDAHRWLRGSGHRSEEELSSLITSQTHELENRKVCEKVERKSFYRKCLIICKESKFYKPFVLCLLIILLFDFSGKAVSIMYALVMIKKMTNSTNAAYMGMLILDGVTVFCSYVGCGLAKKMKRRTLLFVASTTSIFFMLMISLQLYLIKLDLISKNTILSILLLSGYSLAISCGPMILTLAIISELIPLKFRSTMYLLISLAAQASITLLLKVSPLIFKGLEMHGTFMLFAIPSIIILSLLYRYLPETKDKTLQEIEECF